MLSNEEVSDVVLALSIREIASISSSGTTQEACWSAAGAMSTSEL